MKKLVQGVALLVCLMMVLTACNTTPQQTTGVSLEAAQSAFVRSVDVDYSYNLAVRLTEIRTNEVLGYRTAGSDAEIATGDLLFAEMEAIGLTDVRKDAFTLDTWTFEYANLSFETLDGVAVDAILGAYQTQFVTDGPETFTVIYAGEGTEADLDGLDVTGKLVLIDINQRENWWINYPAYEAHLRGAAAILAAQDGGYSEISDDALNAQDICGPADAPAFSISRADSDAIRAAMDAAGSNELTVTLDAKSEVGFDGTSYNIVGTIPGRNPDQMVLMSAHYDSYFDGFQDDNAAIALMMGIAKGLVDSGYRPEKTLVFCALAAEEWGVSNTRYDWSTGAYNQIFRVRPDWAGKVVADINFELPAYSLDYDTDQIRTSYELYSFVDAFRGTIPAVEGAFANGVEIIVPTQTWSDDFSFSIGGIPSSVNALRGDFAALYYHSQFDDKGTYDEAAFLYHHNMYGMLMLAYDRCAVSPLDFTTRVEALGGTIDAELMARFGADVAGLEAAVEGAKSAAEAAYAKVAALNADYESALSAGDFDAADALLAESGTLYADVLAAFKAAEDDLVRLTWEDVSVFPHQLPQMNLEALIASVEALEQGDAALPVDDYLYMVDNNWYAYDWSYETYRFFTDQVLEQPADRLMWGAGRTIGHEDLFDVIRSLMDKADMAGADFTAEIAALESSIARQGGHLVDAVAHEIEALDRMAGTLRTIA